jgi:recombinational DNA repair protein RecT
MSAIQKIQNELAGAKSIKDALTLPLVQDRFIKNYAAVTGRKDGENKFQAEVFAYMEVINEKPDLQNVDRFYHFAALVKCATTGLSFRDQKLYVMPHGKGLKVQPSPAGKREMMEMMADVKKVPQPQLVMKGDDFVEDKLNGTIVKHISNWPLDGKPTLNDILASYIRVYWKDGTITDVVVPQADIIKAKNKSKAQSEAAAWGQLPGEMAKKVAINRGFRLYHKYPDNVVTFDANDDKEEDTSDAPESEDFTDATIVEGAETVDQETGEVMKETPTEEVKPEEKKSKVGKQESFI